MTVRAGGHVLTASGWEPEAVVGEPATKPAKKDAPASASTAEAGTTPDEAAASSSAASTGTGGGDTAGDDKSGGDQPKPTTKPKTGRSSSTPRATKKE